jgi:hypothetical protein
MRLQAGLNSVKRCGFSLSIYRRSSVLHAKICLFIAGLLFTKHESSQKLDDSCLSLVKTQATARERFEIASTSAIS